MLAQLNEIGIVQLVQWDVLLFVYSHGTSIASAQNISRLLGYSKADVGSALEFLSSAGLIERSRNANGVRIYQFARTSPDDLRLRALDELMNMTKGRHGRLLLIKQLRQGAIGKDRLWRSPLHLA